MVSVLVLTITGYAWAAMQGLVDGLTMADVIGEDTGELPEDGARDILLVGMDSRIDAQGNPLPEEMLAKLNAGAADGELNTDTLILVHIPNDGSKAVALSLPRDSYVTVPGFGQHKINSAYARGKAAAKEQLRQEGVTDEQELEVRSNQEGAKTLIATVEALTGQTVDNYASINLLGFYDITNAIGGVEVCLNQATQDPYSGADFKAGKQSISGVQALAFVRQRHGLLRGDLDRIVRQQVFLAGLANKVVSAGTLTDPGKLNRLVEAVKKSVVVNKGWDILSFAQQMKDFTGGQLEFHTIPIENPEYDTPDGLALKVDPGEVRSFVAKLTGKKPETSQAPAPEEITVDIYNTSNIQGLAGSVAQSLVEQGFVQGEVANEVPRQTSVVQSASGERASAEAVAKALHKDIPVEENADVSSGHVRVLLAPDYQQNGNSMPGSPAGGGNAPGAPMPEAPRQAGDESTEQPITADGVVCVN
ncbi:LCP family protein [Saccharomonospora sp.]|uniref:LCP family protein n=1 Tax=Saccharomonospora sp. TaxID=33913 RepID=UPI0026207F25|nr:LCP family protein [Saccharomonospora sp.]